MDPVDAARRPLRAASPLGYDSRAFSYPSLARRAPGSPAGGERRVSAASGLELRRQRSSLVCAQSEDCAFRRDEIPAVPAREQELGEPAQALAPARDHAPLAPAVLVCLIQAVLRRPGA
jgi:hypothetical protein